MASPILGEEIARAYPVVETDGSDSSMLDNTLEFLMYSGIELPKAVMLCIPEPWGRDKNMSREKRDMFHYYASMMEPWDGPAAILFSDGEQVGAVLDRNGLRPALSGHKRRLPDFGLRGRRAAGPAGTDRP